MTLLLLLAGCTGAFSDDIAIVGIDDVGETGILPQHRCLGETTKTVLADWLHATWLVAYGAPAAASAEAVPAFYQLPGVAAAPWFAVNLSSACVGASDRDALCTGGVCYQVECLDGGGWVNHIENDPDVPDTTLTDFGGWTVDRGRLPTTWDGATASLAVEYDVRALTSPDGVDWALSGAGTFTGELALTVQLPHVYPDGELTVVAQGQSAVVQWSGLDIATWDGASITEAECF